MSRPKSKTEYCHTEALGSATSDGVLFPILPTMSQIMIDEITFTNAYLGSQRRSNGYMRIGKSVRPIHG